MALLQVFSGTVYGVAGAHVVPSTSTGCAMTSDVRPRNMAPPSFAFDLRVRVFVVDTLHWDSWHRDSLFTSVSPTGMAGPHTRITRNSQHLPYIWDFRIWAFGFRKMQSRKYGWGGQLTRICICRNPDARCRRASGSAMLIAKKNAGYLPGTGPTAWFQATEVGL